MNMVTYLHMIYPDSKLEEKLWGEGYEVVVGIDEVGRGPLAGPVAAGAVAFTKDCKVVEGVRDSKTLSVRQKNSLYDQIKNTVKGYGVGMVSEKEIDEIGIQMAVLKAMTLALRQVEEMIGRRADYLIVDGVNVELIGEYPTMKMSKGDQKHYSISAASILAKVDRDNLMIKYSEKYPEYGFERNMGYGTKEHMDALKEYGVCDIHRRSYRPVAKCVKEGI
ncbi:MAG: ribonuclease HII [Candidatus Dojkabacteria bacterium]